MTGVIRKDVENYEIMPPAVEDEIFLIVGFSTLLTQDTAGFLSLSDVLNAPRCPELLHRAHYSILKSVLGATALRNLERKISSPAGEARSITKNV